LRAGVVKLPAVFAAPLHTLTHDMKVVFQSGPYIQAPSIAPLVRSISPLTPAPIVATAHMIS
jgi:hypothetical protein